MAKQFEPIAIVGQGCILPGCTSPAELWNTVAESRIQITAPPHNDWRITMERVLGAEPGRYVDERTWSDQGGYVRDFAERFDPAGTKLEASLVESLDPVFQWSLYAARQALDGVERSGIDDARSGVLLGNLSYPTRSHTRFAEQEWLRRLIGEEPSPEDAVLPWNRFMSGLPAMLVAQAFGFEGGALALDAACASSLYAIKIACDRLQSGQADLMLAGGVNAADQLYLHIGFSAVNAMSRSGRSQPFHRDADGLVPAEGAAFVALKRLQDAEKANDQILGVIRGIGLSNDGRSGGFLSPSKAGQVHCMQSALAQAGINPSDIQYVECHATGTTVGDATEIASLTEVYGEHPLELGSLKANLGHTITVSGVAGLLKTLAGMKHGTIPSTPGSRPLTDALADTGFQVSEQETVWTETNGQRTAAVSSFGFGGTNAHLIVQQYAPIHTDQNHRSAELPRELAIVGLGIRTHLDPDRTAFATRVLGGTEATEGFDGDSLTLAASQLAFPPAELKQALGQQLLLLDVTRQATADVAIDHERTGIYVGMLADSETCRYGIRLRWPDITAHLEVDESTETIVQGLSPKLDSAGVIGKMPNIAANRLNNQLDMRAPGFTVSREELSGDAALELACTAIRRGEIDSALVAAVDLCREEVHERAAQQVFGVDGDDLADAAVMLVLKSREQAELDGDTILALLDEAGGTPDIELDNAVELSPINRKLGHAHAASGLLHIALGVLSLQHRVHIDTKGKPQPLLRSGNSLQVSVHNRSFTNEQTQWYLREGPQVTAISEAPLLHCYAAADLDELRERLRCDQQGGDGPYRLALVAPPDELETQKHKALQLLNSGDKRTNWSFNGISFRACPLKGEVAYAFTGAASSYPGMGRELLLGMPSLAEGLSSIVHDMASALDWAYRAEDPQARQPLNQMAGLSLLSQLHAQFSNNVLGLQPTASIGLSAGETNAMFAFGVWDNMNGLFDGIVDSGLYTEALGGSFNAVRTHWELAPDAPLQWESYRIRANADTVAAEVKKIPQVYLTIINSPSDCVIGGDVSACQSLLVALGNPPAVPLGHDIAVHCPAVTPFADTWRTLHTRPVKPVESVRFYSSYFGGVFEPTSEQVAEALTGQALQTIDFPKIVEQAWLDGVRIFVEHGPRNGLTTAIGEILGDREHLAVALDRPGVSGLLQAYRAAAELWCAGVPVDLERLKNTGRAATVEKTPSETGPSVTFRLRPPSLEVLANPASAESEVPPDVYKPPQLSAGPAEGRLMPAAPPLARLVSTSVSQPNLSSQEIAHAMPAPEVPTTTKPLRSEAHIALGGTAKLLADQHRQLVDAHNAYLHAQSHALQNYMASMERIRSGLFSGQPDVHKAPQADMAPPLPAPMQPPEPKPRQSPVTAVTEPARRKLPGPAFTRQQLEILAGGKISSVFGESFAGQDHYPVQVRMPEPPLLLCDRVLGIEGDPHSMGQGRIWTETDVPSDGWYLHHGRMPPGIFIECGQADLLLISWLGIDQHNKGERAYRLLGCELEFHGELPKPGETLEYEISVDGHAQQGDVRLFFFHYDCHVNGERRISVRNGQAGFFTPQELDNAAGVIWTPETADYTPDPKLATAPVPTPKSQFTTEEVEAYLSGDLTTCFGNDFYLADTHTRTPRTPSEQFNFLGEVTALDFTGGPAGRGYMRVSTPVHPDEWFFDGHFKNDPCMPGTLMADACLQAMAFYIVASGRTLQRDGWRFQPARGQLYKFWCRGQVSPQSKAIIYEIFVDEMYDEDGLPTLYAHVLCSVDGRKAFLCERLGLQLVPDWPLSSMPEYLTDIPDTRPVAQVGKLPLDYHSLLNCAWGRPSQAFGSDFAHYDGPKRSPRLPGLPYHFMTRITELHGQMGQMKTGARVTVVYDVPADAWYFQENASATMPSCVLMEVALQPCGWLATYTLSQKASERELLFRNLDGDSVLHRGIIPGDRSITTEVELISVSQVGNLILDKFAVRCTVDGEEIMKVDTVFGFFPPEAMVNQKGFSIGAVDRERLTRASDTDIDLHNRPSQLFAGSHGARLPDSKLLMIDRISGYWPKGGTKGLGAVRSEKYVSSKDWFFKAHFFQDPVQPGSLGIEAILQTIQAFMLLEGMDAGLKEPRFEPLIVGSNTIWHYRGQVVPSNKQITVEFEVEEHDRDTSGVFVIGSARLWVDGLLIYQAPRIGTRIIDK